MRTLVFAKRNCREIARDPVSFIFCLLLPIGMLILFRVISSASAGMAYWFEMPTLAPGMLVFCYTFVMLFMALLVSGDRSSRFLTRLYASPMRMTDFVLGYTLPGLLLGVFQGLMCYLAAILIALFSGQAAFTPAGVEMTVVTGLAMEPGGMEPMQEIVTMYYGGMLLSILTTLPLLLFLVGAGILFGSLLNEKGAPGAAPARCQRGLRWPASPPLRRSPWGQSAPSSDTR